MSTIRFASTIRPFDHHRLLPLSRPLDVLQTRAGITVENGNTDAEGEKGGGHSLFSMDLPRPACLSANVKDTSLICIKAGLS